MNTHFPAQVKTFFGNWSLPIFITEKNRYPFGFVLSLIATVLYMASNHLHFFTPQLLPLFWIDSTVPFIPNTVWIYTSEYIFFIVAYVTCKDLVNLNKFCYSFLVLQVVSVMIFWIWPTTYPRELYPLPDDLNSFTYYIFSILRLTDTPANCCPSLHVSTVYLSSFIFLDDQREKFPFFFIWGTAIALSTLTTKQHYLIDVITGLMMAMTTYWIFHRYIPYRSSSKQTSI